MMPQQALREDVGAEREAFDAWLETVDPSKVKVLDESGVVQGMRLAYGYAKRGERLVEHAPYRQGKRLSLVGWLGFDGEGIVAMEVGTVKGWTFRGFVREHLVPHLAAGDIVVWDNARIHGVEEIEAMIEACGAKVKRQPRYSPEYNPIEHLWSKLKQRVRKARADTAEQLQQAVAEAVSSVTASDARGWFEHCGYLHQSN